MDCQVTNQAQMMAGYVVGLRRQVEDLQAQVSHLERNGDFGSANQPGDLPPLRKWAYVSVR